MRYLTVLLFVLLTAVATIPATAVPAGAPSIYLPIIAKPALGCTPTGAVYAAIPIIPPPLSGNAATNEEYNLGYRGYAPTTTPLQLVTLGPVHDPQAPQFPTLFSNERLPNFAHAYQRYRWLNGQPVDTQSNWGSTVLGLRVTPGEIIRTPDSGYDIGGGQDAMVLYADSQRLTLKYTREDSVAVGYTVYLEDVCVDANLVALYQSLHANGRHALPALTGKQPLGRAINNQIKIAVRDSGHFLDPRSCNDWWQAYNANC